MIDSVRVANSGQVQIEYSIVGKGPPIVLIPSIGRSADDYEQIAELLVNEGFRVVRPQPRGIGSSAGPMTGLKLQDLADDIAQVIEAERLGKVIVAGHAFGNFIARMLATCRPDLVNGVALIAASAGKSPDGGSPFDPEIIAAVYKSGDLNLTDSERLANLKLAFFAPGNDARVWLDGWYPETKAMQREAERNTSVDEFFSAGDVSILDLQALQDTVAPRKYAYFVKQELGDRVTVREIDNAGHALIAEKPVEVAREIASWYWHIFN